MLSQDTPPDLLAAVVAKGPDAVVVVDVRGSIVFANEQATFVLGYANDELLRMNVDTLVPAGSRERHDDRRASFAASPTTRPMGVGLALHAQRADGTLVPVEIALSNTRIGDVGYTIASIRDVTPIRQLMADVARMSHALDATHDGVLLVEPTSFAIIQANDGATRLTGYDRAELVGMSATSLDPDMSVDELRSRTASVLAGTTPSVTMIGPWRRKDGSSITVESTLSRFDSAEDGPILVAIVRDVSDREAARKALSSQRDHFALLLAALDEGTVEMSTDGELLTVNERFCELVGYTSAEVLSATRPFPWVPVESHDETADILRRALAAETFQAEVELRNRRGRHFPVLLTTRRLDSEPEWQPTVFVTVRDLTGQKSAAQALSDARAGLVLSDDRERIARDLHDRVIQRVFGVGLTLEAMLSRMTDERTIDRLRRSIVQLDLTINEIRSSIFDLEQGTSVPLSARVTDLIADYERLLGFAPTLEMVGPVDGAVPAHVAEEILSITREALSNVARHASASAVQVSVTVATEDASKVRVRVRDNGIGIVAPTTAGRGLANMRDRAQRLGGDFAIDSDDGFGTTLTWTAPI